LVASGWGGLVYADIGDSTVAAAGKDTIFDFPTGAFTGHAGELRVVTAGTA
jgi:hypothetical protein